MKLLFEIGGRVRSASLAFGSVLLLAQVAWAEEEDIILMSQRRPLHVTIPGGPAKYGDPELEKAVEGLKDIPQPWTVPKIIAIFEAERNSDPAKFFGPNRWVDESDRLGRLATLLASSRDPRAALSLERALDEPAHFGRYKSAAVMGLYFYFVEDSQYQPVPKEAQHTGFSSNLLVDWAREIKIWRNLNDAILKMRAEEAEAKTKL